MSILSERLKSAQPNPQNKGGCITCRWWETADPETRRLVDDWLDQKFSIKQLWEILTAPTEDGSHLTISNTGFRLHLNHHDEKCRGGE